MAGEGYSEAVGDFSRAIELEPRYAVALYGRGVAYTKLGRPKEAEEDFKSTYQLGQAAFQGQMDAQAILRTDIDGDSSPE